LISLSPSSSSLLNTTPTPSHRGHGWRFDEELWRTPEGYWFVIQPLAPDEAAM
jgi:hypothetical protein